MYRERYPWLAAEKCALVPNGYDDEDFEGIEPAAAHEPATNRLLRLLHLGLLYPEERDPRPFFRAIARLKKEGRVSPQTLRIDLRASGYESMYVQMIRDFGVDGIVNLLAPLPYREALRDAAEADGLLLFQAANCDHQIPAKAYEYLRLRRPILALTSGTGDTAVLLRSTGGATIVDLAGEEAIYRALPDFLAAVARGEHSLPNESAARQYSRRNQAREVAQYLSEAIRVTAQSPAATPSVALK